MNKKYSTFFYKTVTFLHYKRTNIQSNGKLFMTEQDYNNCVTLYADNVFRFIVKNLKHTEDARDVVQTAFEKLWRNREQIEVEKSKAYLFTVAYNQMIDFIRKNKRIQLQEDFTPYDTTVTQQHNHTKKIINDALNTLNETQRSLIMLKDYEGYSYDEIGTIMNLNPSQVKVYLHRARLAMRDFLVSYENIL